MEGNLQVAAIIPAAVTGLTPFAQPTARESSLLVKVWNRGWPRKRLIFKGKSTWELGPEPQSWGPG